jgi:hypothetical protein
MSSGGNGSNGFDGDDALHDAALRRALDHAPDSDATPDPRTRDAIRKMAHNLAPVLQPTPASETRRIAPWWRRMFGGARAPARMPWNAAFATVLVATFVTVLWYREPVPDARLDGEAQVGGASAPAPVQPSAPGPAGAARAPQAPEIQATAPIRAAAPPRAESARDTANDEPARSRADALRRPAPASSSGKQAATGPESDKKTLELPPAPVLAPAPIPAPAPAPESAPDPSPSPPAAALKVTPPSSVAEQSPTGPRAFPRAEERRSSEAEKDRTSGYAGGAPATAAAPAAAPMAPAGPPPLMQRESADSAPALSAQRSANAEPSAALRQAPAPRAAAASKAASPQENTSPFSALDRWTSFSDMRAGQSVRHARGDIEGLAALVNTLARSATEPGADLAAPVETRLELYRGNTLLAVLEVAGGRVRWTPHAGTADIASVGTPPASALAALRALLARQ